MRRVAVLSLSVAGVLAVAACSGGTGTQPVFSTSGFDLTVTGDSTFGAPDGGHTVTVAVVRAGAVVDEASDTVATSGNPAFSFAFPGVLEYGESYDVDYWIDTNTGGGTVGVCDPPPLDQTWQVPVDSVSGPVTLTEEYGASTGTNVCPVFNK